MNFSSQPGGTKKPTKWAKESSPGQSRGPGTCDALGQRIGNDSLRVGVGGPPTPTRGENLYKHGSSTQGMAGGGAHGHLAFGSCYSSALPWAILRWPFRPFP